MVHSFVVSDPFLIGACPERVEELEADFGTVFAAIFFFGLALDCLDFTGGAFFLTGLIILPLQPTELVITLPA